MNPTNKISKSKNNLNTEMSTNKQTSLLDFAKDFFISGTSASIFKTIVFPIDIIKFRMLF